MNSEGQNNRQTIRFSAGTHVIYLGFYFRCNFGNTCHTPAACVMSFRRWYCGAHHEKKTNNRLFHGPNRIPRDPRFYEQQLRGLLTQSALKQQKNVKNVHS